MRCPKCGFISFDHLTSCAKCGRDISQVAAELQGTSIKVEPPMFLSGALAAFSEAGESFEEHAMEADVGGGVDFDMDTEEETISMADEAAEEEVDFSFEEGAAPEMAEAEEPGISLAEPEESGPDVAEADVGADIEFSPEAETESAVEATEESFEELDFMETADEEEEGGLEFDLEDFMEEIDDDKSPDSANGSDADIDIDLGDEER